MTGRDGNQHETRIALVPEIWEVDWRRSELAMTVLEQGTLGFDEHDARWVKRLHPHRWFCGGDGRAYFLMAWTDHLETKRYLRVGEDFYRVTAAHVYPEEPTVGLELRLVDLRAPMDELAAETDEAWGRPVWAET